MLYLFFYVSLLYFFCSFFKTEILTFSLQVFKLHFRSYALTLEENFIVLHLFFIMFHY